jgi:hypothetical protein
MPLRNFVDGDQSLTGAVLSALLLFGSSFLFSLQLGMQFKQANSSLWDGMVVHFINNASVNFFHVVYTDGTESNPTMRIAITQTIMFIIVLVRWYLWRKQSQVLPGRLGVALKSAKEKIKKVFGENFVINEWQEGISFNIFSEYEYNKLKNWFNI